jgi:hypothetical protein
MSISQPVYKWHTFVPVRFSRAVTGAPQADAPDLDDRGFRDAEHGPVMGITAGETVRVKIRRTGLDEAADLWVTSTDATIVSVTSPDHGHLATGASATIHVRGHRGSGTTPNVRTARLQVHFGNASGPVVGELMVWVLRRLTLDLTPHLVTIRGAVGSRASIADIPAIMRMARGIWRPCGIELTAGATRNEDLTFATAGVVADEPTSGNDMSGTEVARILNTRWIPDTINVYFVHRIGTEDTLGYGFARSKIARYHLPNPGIIIADTDSAGTFARDVQSWASTVAHEVGHFLRLEHAGNRQSPNTLKDTWAHRMLMYNYSLLSAGDFVQDVGYGDQRRGVMITMKDLPQIDLDAECGIARNTASARGGPY